MIINDKLFSLFRDKAQKIQVDLQCLGLGYTVVVNSDGGIGIAYTYFADKKSCMVLNETINYEGRPASMLLEKIKILLFLLTENTINFPPFSVLFK